MAVNRREFLVAGAAAGVGLAAPLGARAAEAPAERKEGVLRISSQEGIIPGKDLNEKLDKMEKWGIEGLELGSGVVGNEKQYLDALKDRKVKVSAICWGSIGGALVSEDESKRGPAAEQFKRALTAAGEVGSTGVIYVPAFNGQTKLTNPEIRKIVVDTLPALGEHALSAKSRILLEPLNRGEAYFLRQVADAAAIARDCKNMGVCVMGDFYHMGIEEPSNMGAFIAGGQWLHHVHLASRSRVMPGQDKEDEANYLSGFRGLKHIGYQDFCSFECGCRGNKDEGIPKAVAFLREMWEKATI
jgi:sugar phosphate isomerase/epimerase